MADNNQFRGLLDTFADGSAYKQLQLPTAMQAVTNEPAYYSPLRAAMTDPDTGRQMYVPPNASVPQNMKEAAAHSDPLWFKNQVNDGGPWDYKLLTPDRRYEAFGNFNYGATGSAFGFPQQVLDRAAGMKQILDGHWKPRYGWPLGSAPYGDDPRDQWFINQGIAYARRPST